MKASSGWPSRSCMIGMLPAAGVDALVAISRFTRERYRRLCPDARRIVDIPNGVDFQAFAAPVRARRGCRRRRRKAATPCSSADSIAERASMSFCMPWRCFRPNAACH